MSEQYRYHPEMIDMISRFAVVVVLILLCLCSVTVARALNGSPLSLSQLEYQAHTAYDNGRYLIVLSH